MWRDFVWVDGKFVNFDENVTDMDNKSSVMNNQVKNKILDMGSRLSVLQDNVFETKAGVISTKSVININNYPHCQSCGSLLCVVFSHSLISKQPPVLPTIFRLNSKFDQNMQGSGLKCTPPVTTKFCTRHDFVTVVTCGKFGCDRFGII